MNFSASANASAESLTTSVGIGGKGPNQIAAAFATWAIAFACVCLRMWTRARIVGTIKISDWAIVLSVIAALGQCISKIQECVHGVGRHIQDIDFAAESSGMLQAWWCTLLTYNLTLALTKISICLLYLGIFTLPRARKACLILLAITVVSSLWSLIAVATATIPLQALWDINMKPSFAQSDRTWWSLAGLAIITDILIFVFPIPMIAPLNLPRRQKVLVVGTFAIGFFVCIVSFIRLGILIQSTRYPDPDFTYSGTTLTYWTLIEGHTGIVVACLMTLKPLVSHFFPHLLEPNRQVSDTGVSTGERPLTIGSKPSNALFAGVWAGRKTGTTEGIMMQDLGRRNESTTGLDGTAQSKDSVHSFAGV